MFLCIFYTVWLNWLTRFLSLSSFFIFVEKLITFIAYIVGDLNTKNISDKAPDWCLF